MRSIRTMTSLPASPNGWGARGPAMADARKSYPLLDNQAVAADPRKHAWVSASAGTGKTQVLTARVLRLLLNGADPRSEEHTSELQSLMRISYAVFCLKK